MSPFAARLARLIAAQGPIDLATFMTLAQQHRTSGYYPTRDPLGAAGDFVTAPEISQAFGELLGLALAQAWLDAGRPRPCLVAEAGPGRGTMMADMARAMGGVPGLADASAIHLVETSPALRQVQAGRLQGLAPHWHETLAGLPQAAPLLLVANEFLDALPVRQLIRAAEGWRERRVGLDATGALAFVQAAALFPPAVLPAAAAGTLIELAPAREAWVGGLAARLVAQGGLALLVDYGATELAGDTLQAIAQHREVDPLADPGQADLSTHVAFGPLAAAARRAGATVHGPIPQGRFLDRLGLPARIARLAAGAPGRRAEFEAQAHRLTAPTTMGDRFQVLALTAPSWLAPAGFTAAEAWA